MIYLFAGSDAGKRHLAHERFLKTLPVGTEIFRVGKGDFNPLEAERFYSSSGLFFDKIAVIFSEVLENAEARDFIFSKLAEMEKSENYFIFLEGKLQKTTLDAFKKARTEIEVFEKEEVGEKFNNFLLANALGKKDKLGIWISYRQAIEKGVSLEELAGVLFWKAKDMILKKDFRTWSENELQGFASKFSYLLPEARRAGRDAEAAFEEYLLEAV
ncbi:MAG: hypothetical protein AAB500_00960 [Patescibacteria group bacterium]